jgi:osmoprotectant transport system permease protein
VDARDTHGQHTHGASKGGNVSFLQQALSYIFTAANWGGRAGLATRIAEHLQYTVVAVAVSVLIAVPIGMLIGHTGRGTFLVVTGVNALRALPTLGVLLLGVLLWGLGLVPPTVALMLLGIPPLLAGTYSGIANVDRAVVDAARSMGMTESRVLLRVEVPNAMPLILGGLRTATLQIVATATIAAADRGHRDHRRLRQPRGARPLPDRRHQGAAVLPGVGRRADGHRTRVDP